MDSPAAEPVFLTHMKMTITCRYGTVIFPVWTEAGMFFMNRHPAPMVSSTFK